MLAVPFQGFGLPQGKAMNADERMGRLEAGLEALNQKMENFRGEVISRFDGMDAKIDNLGHGINSRIDNLGHGINSRIDKFGHGINSRIDKLNRTSRLQRG